MFQILWKFALGMSHHAATFLRSMPPHSCRVHQRMHQKALYPDSLKV